mmetsp:Transcript_1732/g.2909  ORF Transcript_1732/g.2909 Transcript_1732/m.2909 type:complete len:296 (-) Transcript_1732:1412-2299(-)
MASGEVLRVRRCLRLADAVEECGSCVASSSDVVEVDEMRLPRASAEPEVVVAYGESLVDVTSVDAVYVIDVLRASRSRSSNASSPSLLVADAPVCGACGASLLSACSFSWRARARRFSLCDDQMPATRAVSSSSTTNVAQMAAMAPTSSASFTCFSCTSRRNVPFNDDTRPHNRPSRDGSMHRDVVSGVVATPCSFCIVITHSFFTISSSRSHDSTPQLKTHERMPRLICGERRPNIIDKSDKHNARPLQATSVQGVSPTICVASRKLKGASTPNDPNLVASQNGTLRRMCTCHC